MNFPLQPSWRRNPKTAKGEGVAQANLLSKLVEVLEDTARTRGRSSAETILPFADRAQEDAVLADALRTLRVAADDLLTLEMQGIGLAAWMLQFRSFKDALTNATNRLCISLGEVVAQVLIRETPSLSALFSQVDVITFQPIDGHPIFDFQRLISLIADPTQIVSEDFWEELFRDVGEGDDGGAGRARMIAVALALLIMAPQTALAMRRGALDFAPMPERRGMPPSGLWDRWHQARDGWVTFTLPLGLGLNGQPAKPGTMYDLAPGLEPDLALTLGIRAARRDDGAARVTDFEFWIGLNPSQDRWAHQFENGWELSIAPGVAVGLGREGKASGPEWHATFRAMDGAPGPLPTAQEPMRIAIEYPSPAGQADFILGPPFDTRLEIGNIGAELLIRPESLIFEIGAYVEEFAAVLSGRFWRTLGMSNRALEAGMRLDGSVDFRYFEDTGFRFEGNPTLEIPFYFDTTPLLDGTFTCHRLALRGGLDTDTDALWFVEVLAHLSIGIGPLEAVVDNIGLRVDGEVLHSFGETREAWGDLRQAAIAAGEEVWEFWAEAVSLDLDTRAPMISAIADIITETPRHAWGQRLEDALLQRLGVNDIERGIEAAQASLLMVVEGLDLAITFLDELEDFFHYPTGFGIGGNFGPAKVGGYLDYTGGPDKRYGGLVTAEVFGLFSVTGAMLHEVVDGESSVIASLGVSDLYLHLGFGVYFLGAGLILGINRTVDTDALKELLHSGAAGNVLFRGDEGAMGVEQFPINPSQNSPLRNAPQLLRDMDALFPGQVGSHVVGPTVKFSWLTIPHVGSFFVGDAGLVMSSDAPGRLVVLASVRSTIEFGPIFIHRLRLDAVGFIDLPKLEVQADAMLVRSKAFVIFDVTGDAMLRVKLTGRPVLVASLGGFYPGYRPEGVTTFREVTRMALTLNPGLFDTCDFRGEAYMAVTTTSVQYGKGIHLTLRAGSLKILGFASFDVLIELSPLQFKVMTTVGLKVRYRRISLASLSVRLTLSGPTPMCLEAALTISVLFFDKTFDHKVNLSRAAQQAVARAAGILAQIGPDLIDSALLIAETVAMAGVLMARLATRPGLALIAPNGGIRYVQSVVPLSMGVSKLRGARLDAPRRLEIALSDGRAGVAVTEFFATPNYMDLSASEAFDLPEYEEQQAGISLGGAGVVSAPVGARDRPKRTRVIEVPDPEGRLTNWQQAGFGAGILQALQDSAGPARTNAGHPQVQVSRLRREFVAQRNGQTVVSASTASNIHEASKVFGAAQGRRAAVLPDTQRPQAGPMAASIEAGDRIDLGGL